METCYNFPLPFQRGMFGAFDIQYINNPGQPGLGAGPGPEWGCMLNSESTASGKTVSI